MKMTESQNRLKETTDEVLKLIKSQDVKGLTKQQIYGMCLINWGLKKRDSQEILNALEVFKLIYIQGDKVQYVIQSHERQEINNEENEKK